MVVDTAETGVRVGFKDLTPTPSNPKTERGISADIRITATEVGWYKPV